MEINNKETRVVEFWGKGQGNTKMDLKREGCEDDDWFHLIQRHALRAS